MMNLLQANSEEINKRLSIRILLTFRCQDSSNFVYVQQPQAILYWMDWMNPAEHFSKISTTSSFRRTMIPNTFFSFSYELCKCFCEIRTLRGQIKLCFLNWFISSNLVHYNPVTLQFKTYSQILWDKDFGMPNATNLSRPYFSLVLILFHWHCLISLVGQEYL